MIHNYGYSKNENPLIGHWVVNIEKTIASTKEGSTAYLCFINKECGLTNLVFTENTVTAITFSHTGSELWRHTEPYKIISVNEQKVEIELTEIDKVFTYNFNVNEIYYSSEKNGFTEHYQLKN